jgi:Bacteriophage T7, probable scaffold protein Gp13
MICVRPARHSDAADVAPRLRIVDLEEVRASLGEPARSVLEEGIAESDPCYAVTDEAGSVLGLFGVVPQEGNEGVGRIWLLGSEELVAERFYFARNSRIWVDCLQERYRVLWNWVDARNQVHIRWLKWCGFTVTGMDEKYGVEGRPFYEFKRIRD